MAGAFIGSGWAFPVRPDATGRIALVSGRSELEEAVRLVLGTAPGERPMRPEFGCRIHELVFDTSHAETAGRIAYEVRTALARWEPRIEVLSVDVTFNPESDGVAFINIGYTPAATNDPRNLVFPFYLIPEERASGSADQ